MIIMEGDFFFMFFLYFGNGEISVMILNVCDDFNLFWLVCCFFYCFLVKFYVYEMLIVLVNV